MSSARPPAPARDTGLPPGVRVGPLGRRFVAYLVDSVVPAVAVAVINLSVRGDQVNAPLAALGVLVELAWLAVFLQQLAVRAASPGMRLLKLQLVGFLDGRPVGWGRAVVRWLVFVALSATGIGLLLLLGSLLTSPRRQGWHDRAANAVVIVARALAPRAPRNRPAPGPLAAGPVTPSPAPGPVTAAPVTAAVAGDPAVGPELAPLAGEPASTPYRNEANGSGRRTILDGWVAELDDGREIVVRGLVLLGRNPQPEEGEADAELVKLPDESRTVSKTHLALGVDDAGLFVVDRGSTNGSTLTAPGEPTVPVSAFHAVPVVDGSVVSIGDHWVRIRRTGA